MGAPSASTLGFRVYFFNYNEYLNEILKAYIYIQDLYLDLRSSMSFENSVLVYGWLRQDLLISADSLIEVIF